MTVKERHYYLIVKPELQNTIMPGTETSNMTFLILTCSCQYSYNLMLTSNCMCRPYIDTNNPQGMRLGKFKNRTPEISTKDYLIN
jgi:hypothetical protein